MLTTASLAVSRQILHSNIESSFFSSSLPLLALLLADSVEAFEESKLFSGEVFVVSGSVKVPLLLLLAADVDAELRSSKLGAVGVGCELRSTVEAIAS